MGAPAKPFPMALGALIIKEKLGISDRETVEQIRENPYLQYFIGLSEYRNEPPFEFPLRTSKCNMSGLCFRPSCAIVKEINFLKIQSKCNLVHDPLPEGREWGLK